MDNNWNSKTFHIVDATIVYRSVLPPLTVNHWTSEYGPGGDGKPNKNKMKKKDTLQY